MMIESFPLAVFSTILHNIPFCQWEKTLSIDAAVHQERLVWQKQQRGTRCGTVAENERLKERVQVLGRENYELTRMLKNERIRNRDEDASQRRSLRQAAAKARLETRAARRLQVMEAAAVQQANMQIKQLEEVIYDPLLDSSLSD